MLIIGINSSGYTTSAAVVVDGKLLFGCAEERLDRQKLSKYFPIKSIKACLDYVGAKISEVDYFAIGYNPGISVASRTRTGYSEWPAYPGARFFSNPNYILPIIGKDDFEETEQIFKRTDNSRISIRYVTHHLSHASNAFFLSQYSKSAIFSCDGYGERATTVWGYGSMEEGIQFIKQIDFPNSIGGLYATITQFLGFKPDSDEWKVMGAAAYGDPNRFYKKLKSIVKWDNDGQFLLDLSYFNHFNFDVSPLYTKRMLDLLGVPRNSNDFIEQVHYDIAAAIQKVTEEYVLVALRWLYSVTKCNSVCLTGGVALNSLCNGKLSLSSPFENIYIPYAPDDSGNSVGAALWVLHKERKLNDIINNSPYIGRSYSDETISNYLKNYNIKYKHVTNISEEVAGLLIDGKIIGWFQGRMEFGPRALGARSIIADPRCYTMKDKINKAVKYREAFRPFAPAILEEFQVEYFETEKFIPTPYMERILPVRKSKQSNIPAVVHNDGTGRLQTVSKNDNELFYNLIYAFYNKTRIPVILNTSFNLNGEPIVESPADAIRTFFSSGMDALVIGSFLIEK